MEDKIRLRPGHALRFGLYFLARELEIPNASHVMGIGAEMRAREVELYDSFIERMRAGEDSPLIEIVEGLEDVCAHCPESERCDSGDTKEHDRAIAEVTNLSIGTEYKPRELLSILRAFHETAQQVYERVLY
ncbi:MAG: DUF1284 domain-containing protein [archaeon]